MSAHQLQHVPQESMIDSVSAALGMDFSASPSRPTNPAYASLEGCATAPATMRCLEAQSAYLAEFLPDHLNNGEHGYTLALFQTAIGHLSTVAANHAPRAERDGKAGAAEAGSSGAEILPIPPPPPPPPPLPNPDLGAGGGDDGDVEHLRADLVADVVGGEDGLGLQEDRGGPFVKK